MVSCMVTHGDSQPDPGSVDFSTLRPIDGMPDLALPEVAVKLSMTAAALMDPESGDWLEQFLEDPANLELLDVAVRLSEWSDETANEGFDSPEEITRFLGELRSELLEVTWSAYDPDGQIDVEKKLSIGDVLVGSSLFWGFMTDREIVTDPEASVWSALWSALAIDPIIRHAVGTTISPAGDSTVDTLGQNPHPTHAHEQPAPGFEVPATTAPPTYDLSPTSNGHRDPKAEW